MKAPQTAGIIHTDFEKGFIRAEVIKYDDYVALGSEKACRDAGKIGIEGRTTSCRTATSCTSCSTSDTWPQPGRNRVQLK